MQHVWPLSSIPVPSSPDTVRPLIVQGPNGFSQSVRCSSIILMEPTTHERHILASDRALIEASKLVLSNVPLLEWPAHLRAALSMALAQACDDTRLAKNRVSAERANQLVRFLSLRGIQRPPLEDGNFEGDAYIMDRFLADLVTKVCALNYARRGTMLAVQRCPGRVPPHHLGRVQTNLITQIDCIKSR